MPEKFKLLFLCTGNACRSQMAEGLCRHFRGDRIDAYSAGIEKHGLNPSAVRVMREIGIDISGQQSKTLGELGDMDFDAVVTVCGHAEKACPVFPRRTQRIHKAFDDPPKLAAEAETAEQALEHYRRVRDQIETYVLSLPASLNQDAPD